MDGSALLDEHSQPRNRSFNAARLDERAIDTLIGICMGALADGMIVKSEAELILKWVERNRSVMAEWPANQICPRIQEMLADGAINLAEQGELLDLLADITGEGFGYRSTSLPLTKPSPDVIFQNRAFCMTGKFVYGPRRKCEEEIIRRGGNVSQNVVVGLNYLVIGTVGSSDWIHATYGRKIEKAVEFRDKGHSLAIISEEHWASFLSSPA
jgi:NAD-dependent DNA ligase